MTTLVDCPESGIEMPDLLRAMRDARIDLLDAQILGVLKVNHVRAPARRGSVMR